VNTNTILATATVLLSIPSAALATIDALHRRRPPSVAGVPFANDRLVAATEPQPNLTSWPPPAVGATPSSRRVSVPRRILSYLIDVYAWIFASTAVDVVLAGPESYESDGAAGLGFVVVWIGLSVTVARTGRSPGKLLVGARLVPVGDSRGHVSVPRAIWRSLVASVVSICFISQLAALGNSDRVTLHDRWTKTRVVSTRVNSPSTS
jgi:uncharacterized RDD family membrane protein YckC